MNQEKQLDNTFEQMDESIVVALRHAMESEDDEMMGEVYSYAAIHGDMTNEQLDKLFERAIEE